MVSVWKHILVVIVTLALASVLALVHAPAAYADLGDRVTNIATISQDANSGRLVFQTNEASFIIEARQTPSEIEFFRVAAGAPDAVSITLNGSDYSPSGDPADAFLPIEGVSGPSGVALNTPSTVPLVPASTYLSGEIMVVRVIDTGQNGDPNVIETVLITVRADNGDRITLRLYEDGPNTGQFYAFFPSSAADTPQNDITITAPQDTVLTATYIDAFDASEVSVDTAFISPFGRVFDSFTGELLDGVAVTLIDVSTGLPATVLGVDGAGDFPARVRTGEDVTDSAGITYTSEPGAFFYPILAPGTYRLQVDAPEGYLYPSVRVAADFDGLQNAPFTIDDDASYSQDFTIAASGPLNLDVPLDPNGDLVVRKEASDPAASVGDFVGYTVTLENEGNVPAPFTLRDNLPRGLRYVAGSVRLNGAVVGEPQILADGETLLFSGGLVLAGESARLTYLTSVGPGAQTGEAVNRAVAINSSGEELSNVAEAAVIIEEDLFSSRLTIVGRVADAACTPDDNWARELSDGKGIANVRIYMETGRYVVTDENGLFHFEGIEPGTHVVQLDEATLPKGYDPVVCEENSRYAGSAISKFVDAQGGTLWRANFYLERNGEALDVVDQAGAMLRDADKYDAAWLDGLTKVYPRWAYPALGQTPNARSLDLGFVHGPNDQVELRLNEKSVSGLNFAGRQVSKNRTLAISRWTGVDIQRGENRFEAVIYNQDGQVIERQGRTVWFVDEVNSARLVDDRSVTVADGRTKPVIAIRLEDGSGHAVHEGRLAEINVSEPYRLAQEAEQEFEAPVSAAFNAATGVSVGADGVALVELEPTLKSGRVRVQVKLNDGSLEEIDVWLQPEKREWVVVGLAEAEGLLSNIDGDGSDDLDEVSADGRIAFFAKGVIRGDWLLTIAVDTAKRRGTEDGGLFDEIDPNAYYTLYGDRTWQNNDAESRYPLYVKLEKDSFQALFGDYETDLTDTDLGRYSRRLSGLKVDYESENVSITAFAAETNQTFMKDELAADGTSGPYRLQSAPIIRSSETIAVETRDRFRPDEVVNIRTLSRYIDYEIDYTTGELFFRYPIAAADPALNPNVIVVDYETASAGERGITAGGRAAARFADGKVETGVTIIHEEDGNSQGLEGSDLISADVTVSLGQNEFRAELAASSAETEQGKRNGQALLLEAERRTETLSVTGYYREETAGFGLGQQSSQTSAIRRVGAQLSAELGVKDVAEGSDRSVRRVEAQAYREENLTTGARRDVADVSLRQDSQTLGGSVGLRAVSEDFEAVAAPRQSVLLTGSARKTFVDQGLTLTATHEEPVYTGGSNDDEATLFPGRTVVGLDKTLGRQATLNLRHEVTNGANASGDNTVAGISWEPRNGTQVRAAADMITNDSGRRIGATVGVDQIWQVNEAWTVGGGLARRANVDGGDQPLDVAPDAAVSPLEDGVRSALTNSESYTSGYLGAAYQVENTAVSARAEMRDSATGKRLVATLGGAREVTETLSFSAAARYQDEQLDEAADSKKLDVRIGAAWRPRGEGLILLNRFDVGSDEQEGQLKRTKVVNNLSANMMISDRTQAALYHGIKYVETEFEGAKADGVTQLVGGEVRHDVTKKLDLGLHGAWTSGDASGTDKWSFGPSIGYTPKENVWVSVGWNVSGFEDEDFEAARYTQQGPYIKLRAKFDQDTLKGVIKGLGLGAE
jgi:uncharacterized repeat protein (TIGR01451 family)